MKFTYASEGDIKSWIAKSDELARDAYTAMHDTAQLVEEIQQFSSGSLVDELVHAAHGVLEVAKAVTGTFEEISGVIKDVTTAVGNVVESVSGAISGFGKAISGVFGG